MPHFKNNEIHMNNSANGKYIPNKSEPKYLISPIFLSPLIKILYAMNAFKTSVPLSKGVNFRLL